MKVRKELSRKLKKRITIKIGSSCITKDLGGVDSKKLNKIVKDIAFFKKEGFEVVLVCSGAIQTGREILNFNKKGQSVTTLQALSSVGQVRLIHELAKAFQKENYSISQILLNHQDFKHNKSYLNIKNTIELLLENNVIPIINENDTVSFEEITFGDNDQLAVMTCELLNINTLLILTSVDGIYDSNPDINLNAKIIPEINSDIIKGRIKLKGKSKSGTGGMDSKFIAISMGAKFGVTTLIGTYKKANPLQRLLYSSVGTIYHAEERILSSRKNRLLALAQKDKYVMIDEGAESALSKGASLLATGIKKVEGTFKRGDCLLVKKGKKIIAAGLCEYSSKELKVYLQDKSTKKEVKNIDTNNDLFKIFIHRNNMSFKISQ
ncbi:glutamate 5-kinase [Bacteriovoracaceae bacterium]|nr:glutamate 5-kinase [Bacteriovoracaceae bacterium]